MSVIALVISIAAAVFAYLLWRIAKRTMVHHALEDVHKEYRSPEMLFAIKRLWQLRKENGENFVGRYEEIRKEDEEWVSSLDRRQRIEAEQSTLHYQRRLVSIFYQHLAALYVNYILPKDIVFNSWPEEDLRIIPEIIVPIENKLHEVLHTPPKPPFDEKNYLPLKLYSDSRRYEAAMAEQ